MYEKGKIMRILTNKYGEPNSIGWTAAWGSALSVLYLLAQVPMYPGFYMLDTHEMGVEKRFGHVTQVNGPGGVHLAWWLIEKLDKVPITFQNVSVNFGSDNPLMFGDSVSAEGRVSALFNIDKDAGKKEYRALAQFLRTNDPDFEQNPAYALNRSLRLVVEDAVARAARERSYMAELTESDTPPPQLLLNVQGDIEQAVLEELKSFIKETGLPLTVTKVNVGSLAPNGISQEQVKKLADARAQHAIAQAHGSRIAQEVENIQQKLDSLSLNWRRSLGLAEDAPIDPNMAAYFICLSEATGKVPVGNEGAQAFTIPCTAIVSGLGPDAWAQMRNVIPPGVAVHPSDASYSGPQ
jgi:hypothetical protein